MTTTEKIAQERTLLYKRLGFLSDIRLVDNQLKSLKHNHKDTESKELEIHLMWTEYQKL